MKKLSTKTILVIFVLLILLLVGAHFLVFSFIKSAGTTVSVLEQDIRTLQEQAIDFSKYSPEDLKKLAESVNSRIVSQDDFVNFIENIEGVGRAQGVSIIVRSVDVEPRSEDTADDKENMRLKLETTGSWENTQRYINYLEHLPYKINITNLNLSILKAEGSASSTPTWRGGIELTTLKFK